MTIRVNASASVDRFDRRQRSFALIFRTNGLIRRDLRQFYALLIRNCTIRDRIVRIASFLYNEADLVVFLHDRSFGRFARLLLTIFGRFVGHTMAEVFNDRQVYVIPSSAYMARGIHANERNDVRIYRVGTEDTFHFLLSDTTYRRDGYRHDCNCVVLLIRGYIVLVGSLLFVSFLPIPATTISVPLLPPRSIFSTTNTTHATSCQGRLRR